MTYTGQQVMTAIAAEIASKPDFWVSQARAKIGADIDGNQWLINLETVPGVTDGTMAGADTTLTLTEENLNKILNGEIKPLVAIHTGVVQLTGKAGPATATFQLLVRAKERL